MNDKKKYLLRKIDLMEAQMMKEINMIRDGIDLYM